MKKLVMICAISALSVTMALASNPKKPSIQNLRMQIVALLNNPDIEVEHEFMEANILFTLNAKDEIVILTVDTEHAALEDFIKTKLSYTHVFIEDFIIGKDFRFTYKVFRNNS